MGRAEETRDTLLYRKITTTQKKDLNKIENSKKEKKKKKQITKELLFLEANLSQFSYKFVIEFSLMIGFCS